MNFQLDDYQREFVATVRGLAQREFAASGFAPHRDGLSREWLRLLAANGLGGIMLSEEDGGQGGNLVDAVLAIEAVAEVSSQAGDCLQALNFGAIQQLARHGSLAQKRRFLTPCLSGEKLITIAMTEPEAGSAVTDLRTSAREDGAHVLLNGRKIFSTNGDAADYFCVWVKFGEDRKAAGAVLVERDTPGFEIDATHRFMSGERYGMLYFEDCRVPHEQILVREEGFRKMMSVFNVERLGNAARSLAYGQAALNLSVDYARARRQFGRRLADFQGLQWRFAEMKLKVDSARLLLYRAATNADGGIPSILEASLAKLACNRAGFEVAHDALQIFGGYGYDQEAAVNYIFRRTRGWMIAGGTAEQMLNRIASELLGEDLRQR